MEELIAIGRGAKTAAKDLNRLGQKEKNQLLLLAADTLSNTKKEILVANEKDIFLAKKMK